MPSCRLSWRAVSLAAPASAMQLMTRASSAAVVGRRMCSSFWPGCRVLLYLLKRQHRDLLCVTVAPQHGGRLAHWPVRFPFIAAVLITDALRDFQFGAIAQHRAIT